MVEWYLCRWLVEGVTDDLVWNRRLWNSFCFYWFSVRCSSSNHKCQYYNFQASELPHESMLQCYYNWRRQTWGFNDTHNVWWLTSVNFCRPMELFSRSWWMHKINIVISKFIWNLCNHSWPPLLIVSACHETTNLQCVIFNLDSRETYWFNYDVLCWWGCL